MDYWQYMLYAQYNNFDRSEGPKMMNICITHEKEI